LLKRKDELASFRDLVLGSMAGVRPSPQQLQQSFTIWDGFASGCTRITSVGRAAGAPLWAEFGFHSQLLLKTKGQIGFVS
jgi:hypothetical protein